MTWALDKQQAAQKYTQITVNGLPHQPPTRPLLLIDLNPPPRMRNTRLLCMYMPAFSRTLVKMLARKVFGAGCGCNAQDLRDHKMFYQIGNRRAARGVEPHF